METSGDGGQVNSLTINSLTDDLLEAVFLLLSDSDRKNVISVCKRFRHACDASSRILTSCFATPDDSCLGWLRRHQHAVTYLNVDPEMADHMMLQMVAIVAARLTNLVVNVNKPNMKIAGDSLPRLKFLDVEAGPKVSLTSILRLAATLPALEYLRVASTRNQYENVVLPQQLLDRGQLRQLVIHKSSEHPHSASRLTLGASLAQLPHLTELVACSMIVDELPVCISSLTDLHSLAVTGTPMGDTLTPMVLHHASLASLAALRVVQLEYCALMEVPAGLLQLTGVQKLSLEGNRMVQLPEELGALTNLEALVLGHNLDLRDLPDSMSRLTKLTELDVHSCELAAVPACVCQLPALLDLKLSFNVLRDLPGGAYLTGLTRLDIGANMLEELPPALHQASALQELLIDDQRVEEEGGPLVFPSEDSPCVLLLTARAAGSLLEWHPALRLLAVVKRGRELQGGSDRLRDLWFDKSFDEALQMLRGRGISVQ